MPSTLCLPQLLKLLLLPRRWNVTHVYYLGPFRDLSGISARDLFTLQRDPYVVHFTGPTKPWMYIMTHPFQDTYWQPLRRTLSGTRSRRQDYRLELSCSAICGSPIGQ